MKKKTLGFIVLMICICDIMFLIGLYLGYLYGSIPYNFDFNQVQQQCGLIRNSNYISYTKAFDVSKQERCDFYIESLDNNIINITKTYCINI